MYSVPLPTFANHCLSSFATNSGPLRLLMATPKEKKHKAHPHEHQDDGGRLGRRDDELLHLTRVSKWPPTLVTMEKFAGLIWA